jgi:hypothetical protein
VNPMMTIPFLGWNKDDGHDKIWGIVVIDEGDDPISFWGRRGGSYTFKKQKNGTALRKLERNKIDKGYKAITDVSLLTDNFIDDLGNQLFVAKLFDKFHGMPKYE